ncbi:MAG: ATP-binding cassette domain-containing protein [Comamonas sp.]
MDNASVLTTQGWGVAFGDKVVLAELDVRIEPGMVTALLGPSGAGKSTLVRTLAGLHQDHPRFKQWGQVQYLGQTLGAGEHPRLVVQKARLMQATVLQAITEFHRERVSVTPGEIKQWCARHVVEMGFAELVPLLDRSTVELGSLQQRAVAILREAAARPALLMVDEPTAGLDDADSARLLDLLGRLAGGMAIVLITHNQRHARVAQRMLLLAGGRIQEAGGMEAFLNAPQSEAGRQYVRTGSCAVAAPDADPESLSEDVPAPAALPAQALAALAAPAPAPLPPPAVQATTPVADVLPAPKPAPMVPDMALIQPIPAAFRYIPASRGPRGFAWVVPGRLAGTPKPGVVQSIDVDLTALRTCGVTTLVTLTETNMDQAALARHGMRNVFLPVKDREPPSVAQLQMLMIKMKRLLLGGEVLAVHCLAGLGRTGTVLAAWLIFEGVTAEEALRRVRAIESQYVQSDVQEAILFEYEELLLRKM